MSGRVLLFSHSGFSDGDANGITMKNLLSAWPPEQKAEFYCDRQQPDFTAAHSYFRVTDTQAIKALLGRKSRHIFTPEPEREKPAGSGTRNSPGGIPRWLKKRKYNFVFKWLRELIWKYSPWGHRDYWRWVQEVDPAVLVYMVGESLFLDDLVLETCRRTGKPLVLYSGEAYRLIRLDTRRGLERAYYRKSARRYEKLCSRASLVIYNSEMLKEEYECRYPATARGMVAYNSARCDGQLYVPGEDVRITYFGNLGVGRSAVLLEVAAILARIDPTLRLDIYGNAPGDYPERFRQRKNIAYHGFVAPQQLRQIIDRSDILLHVESFAPEIIPKLRYAFSTKIAQCLCAGRCFVSYAPEGTASSRYLAGCDGAVLVSDPASLEETLRILTADGSRREVLARSAARIGRENHDMDTVAGRVREEVGKLL